MKIRRSIPLKTFILLSFMLLLGLAGFRAHAQEGPFDLSGLTPLDAETVPEFGTFISLQRIEWQAPLPYNPFPELPVYSLGEDGYYVVDDMTVDYDAFQAEMELEAVMDELFSMDDFGGGMSFALYSYPSDSFYMEITSVSNSLANLVLHGTVADTAYEILSKTDLTNSSWVSEGMIIGAVDQDWTPTTVPVGNRTNTLYFWARSWADTDSDGLPDWWETALSLDPNDPDTGDTGTSDGYKDPDNDGWTNLQEYQNGTNPTSFSTPPSPIALSARYDATGTNAIITWASGGGPVESYTIQRMDYSGEEWTASASATALTNSPTLTVSIFGYTNYLNPTFRVHAHFAGDIYTSSANITVGASIDIKMVRGPGGNLYFIMANPPQDISSVRVKWRTLDTNTFHISYPEIELDGSNIVNGTLQLPRTLLETYLPDDFSFSVRLFYDNGNHSELFSVVPAIGDGFFDTNQAHYPLHYGFVDGRAHLKENLKFLLRAATVDQPFSYGSFYDYFSSYSGWAVAQDEDLVDDYFIYGFNFWDSMFFDAKWFVRTPVSTDYEYSGFHIFDSGVNASMLQELRPIQENFFWRNFAWNSTNFSTSTTFNTGAGYDSIYYANYSDDQIVRTLIDPLYGYAGSGAETNPPLAFSITNATWLFAGRIGASVSESIIDAQEFALTYLTSPSRLLLQTGAKNCFGLDIASLRVDKTNTLVPGVASRPSLRGGVFLETAIPDLQTVDYYFASQTPFFSFHASPPPMPGTPDFTVTNTSPLLIASVGQLFTVAGWAKQAIVNGYSGKYGYLEQYFDKAYTVATNGVATTNQTGLLSPYGEFFPTEPGRAALITLPDIETDQRGTGIVDVIKIQLDVNHDGVMDLSYAGPDNTSANRPFTFWANNDYDRLAHDKDDNAYYEDSVESAGCPFTDKTTPDCNYRDGLGNRVISSTRDLQDCTRLWVSGITTNMLAALPANSTVTLSWGDVGSPNSGNPTIDLFKAADADGGIGYLTNSTTALVQTLPLSYPYIGRLGPGQSIQLNASTFSNNWAGNYFVWCGVTNGNGSLTITIANNGTNILAQTASYIKIQDIKQMYERWTIGDDPSFVPTTNAKAAQNEVNVPFQYGPSTDTNTPYILFVHGWNMKRWEKDRFAESAFKRLYWQGYQGRFGLFRWPTHSGFSPEFSAFTSNPLTDPHNYDNSELRAWQSAAGLSNELNHLNAQYPGHVYLLAHSMGNVVAGEALRLAATNQLVNTYIASQGAIPAHVYDSSVTNLLLFVYNHPDVPNLFEPSGFNYGPETPNIYGDRLAGNSAAVGRRINFYNMNDFALAQSRWGYDQIRKPDTFVSGGYSYSGSTNDASPWNHFSFVPFSGSPISFDIVNNIINRYEVMAFAAESWSTALGATPSVTTFDAGIDLTTIWPTDLTGHNHADHLWHSAQFRGDSTQQWGYWRTLLRSPTVGFNINN